MLCMGHFPTSTPTKGLEIIFNYTPLDIKASEEAAKAAARIKGRNKIRWDGVGHGLKKGHLRYYQKEWGQLDTIPTVYNWHSNIKFNSGSLKSGTPATPEGMWDLA